MVNSMKEYYNNMDIYAGAGRGLVMVLFATYYHIWRECSGSDGESCEDVAETGIFDSLSDINDALAAGAGILYNLAAAVVGGNVNVVERVMREFNLIAVAFDMNAVTVINGPIVEVMNREAKLLAEALVEVVPGLDDAGRVSVYPDLPRLILQAAEKAKKQEARKPSDASMVAIKFRKAYDKWRLKSGPSELEKALELGGVLGDVFSISPRPLMRVVLRDLARAAVRGPITACTMNIVRKHELPDDLGACSRRFVSTGRGAYFLREVAVSRHVSYSLARP